MQQKQTGLKWRSVSCLLWASLSLLPDIVSGAKSDSLPASKARDADSRKPPARAPRNTRASHRGKAHPAGRITSQPDAKPANTSEAPPYPLSHDWTWTLKSTEQSPSWEANSHSASQEIPHFLWYLKIHYNIHKSLTLVPILSQRHPLHTFPLCFLKIHLQT
jgi:hypothetical protein